MGRHRREERLFAARGTGRLSLLRPEIAERPEGFGNSHGWAGLASAALAWHAPESRWTWQLRIDRLVAHESFDTTQLTLGAGYRLHQDGTFRDNATPAAHASEIDVMAGRTIVNSFESESAGAGAIELRHAFAPALRASLGWISEGDARLIRRNGLLAQAWLEPSFGGDRFTLGVGLGPYFAFDAEDESGPRVHAVISTTASYHFADRWTGRITWHRIASNYNRDSDIVLAGLGYRF